MAGGTAAGEGRALRREAKVTDVADLRKVTGEDKRLTLIVSLLHTVRTGVRDDVVTMFCKRIGAIHKKGRDQLEAWREARRAESERLLGVFGEVLSVVREAVTPAGTESEDPSQAEERRRPPPLTGQQPSKPGGWCSRPWTRREGLRR